MPNTPVALGKGVLGAAVGNQLAPAGRSLLSGLLERLGEVIWIDEDQMDALTSVSGSGPAFVYRWIEAFEAAAQQQGFSRQDAELMVRQTFVGALELLEDQGGDAAALRRAVTSKAGMTEAGLRVMDQSDPNGLMRSVLAATAARGAELALAGSMDLAQRQQNCCSSRRVGKLPDYQTKKRVKRSSRWRWRLRRLEQRSLKPIKRIGWRASAPVCLVR